MPNINQIKPQRANANRHTPRGMKTLEDSIQRDGWIGAITVAADHETFDGSARLEVGAATGFEDAIVVRSDGSKPVIHIREDIPSADDPRAKRLGIAANRVAQLNLEWSPEVIAELASEGDVLDGLFSDQELTDLLASLDTQEGAGGDEFDTTPQEGPTRVQPGELWQLGAHRLLCGDSTKAEDVARLMGNDKPTLMVTDPPYGVEYDANWRNVAAAEGHLAYAPSRVSPVQNDDRRDWTEAWRLFPGDVAYCWHADRHASEVQVSLEMADFEIRCQVIWAKSNYPISRGHYHWRHEPCWYAVKKGRTASWVGGHKQTTLWEINLDKNVEGGHSTQKPLECMMRPLQNHAGDVYDPFLGSGTTLIAAERTHRKCYGMEIEPRYCDVILRRWEAETNREAVRLDG